MGKCTAGLRQGLGLGPQTAVRLSGLPSRTASKAAVSALLCRHFNTGLCEANSPRARRDPRIGDETAHSGGRKIGLE